MTIFRACPGLDLRLAYGERFNGFSHLLGLVLSLVGGVFLCLQVAGAGNSMGAAGAAIFALTLVLLYAASTLYHASHGASKEVWRRADHCAIYLAIAGTYTPFGLVALGGWPGAALVGTMWIIALAGIVRETRASVDAHPSLSRYLGMGWLAVLAAAPVIASLDKVALAWLMAGAASYSLGTVFYRNRRGWKHAHGIWHMFVLGGSASHYAAIRSVVL